MIKTVLSLVAVSALAAGCAATGAPSPTPAAPAAPAATTGPTVPAIATDVSAPKPWSTEPVTVVHQPNVPPVPVMIAIRYAAHRDEGYDRIVFDIAGALPGYTVKYVSQVRADGSDQPVSVPGSKYLLMVMTPAQAHRETGGPTVSGVHRVDLPMLESYAVVGDYEGHVSIALGLNGKAGYRVGELDGRIYIDVQAR